MSRVAYLPEAYLSVTNDFECDVTTYVEEAVFVHVSKHLYDVSSTEGQLRLNRAMNKQTDEEQKQDPVCFITCIRRMQV